MERSDGYRGLSKVYDLDLKTVELEIGLMCQALKEEKVDERHEPARKVAVEFLDSLGLKTSIDREGTPDVVIGSKSFTEQFIVVELLGILIENYSNLSVALKTGLAGTKICFEAAVSGEIDLLPGIHRHGSARSFGNRRNDPQASFGTRKRCTSM